ncbi:MULTISPECIES: PD40 domain-containing protein [Pseudoalteromonas]|uniref:Uncharacterized protein n=1 Tax=Pseudoalteromonas amylolytica TaxID=1859457 RepID=A0A1S1MRP4_9GAMM|nr:MULTISPECIES: PD40 domain-containing protein [Pseudoalteromonas]OHU87850.1 hypothetical protein BFC16_10585 [Pseudoalteromonas sp. JW3]OHU91290.1 hypothetical protein BET10_10705 [Pseudoalteromonas amylolytica]
MKIIVGGLTALCVALSANAELITSLSSTKSEYNLNFHPKFGRVLLARSDRDFENAKVWEYQHQDNSYTTPRKINLGPTEFKYSDPMYVPNSHKIYFISDKPMQNKGNSRDYNIWHATLMNGQATEVTPLNTHINSKDDEFGPELHQGRLYFSRRHDRHYALMSDRKTHQDVTLWDAIPRQDDIEMRSDLTFSPDAKVAVFWQISKTSPQADIYASRLISGQWSSPIKLLAGVNSQFHEISPQFSPDGKWLYFSSERPEPGFALFNIHRVSTEQAFPKQWYNAHFAPKKLNLLADVNTLKAITEFTYTLTLHRKDNTTKQHVRVNYQPFRLKILRDNTQYDLGNKTGIKTDLHTQRKVKMSEQEIAKELRSLRLNFLDLFKKDDTRLYRQYNETSPHQYIYRVESSGIAPFSILVDQHKQKILRLFYDNSNIGIESDYKKIDGIWWPHAFSFHVDNEKVATGVFSDMCIAFINDNKDKCESI